MEIRRVPPASCILTDWNITVNQNNGEMHFVGYELVNERSRLSTPIKYFDEESGIGTTISGSQYKVIGQPSMPHPSALILYQVNLMRGNLLIGSDFKWKYSFEHLANLH